MHIECMELPGPMMRIVAYSDDGWIVWEDYVEKSVMFADWGYNETIAGAA